MMTNYVEHDVPGGSPLKMWTKNVRIEDEAIAQMKNVAMLPIIHKHVAAMPDCHWGMGATVGSVIERAMAMDDSVWERHANPWSAWSRVPILPLLCL
ncbi:MAG: DUF6653 family protein, partial [Pseudomonadota bacterium]